MERLQIFNVSISNGNIKCPDRKIDFWNNLALKLFRATIANVDIESQKSLPTFLTKCLYHMLVKFEQICIVPTTQNFELFDKNQAFKNHFWQSVDAILEDVFVAESIIQCSTINLKITIFQCSKNYDSPTRITRLKAALNMADPTYHSLNSWRIPFAMLLKSMNKDKFYLCIQQLPTGETNLMFLPWKRLTKQWNQMTTLWSKMLIDEIGINNCTIQIFGTNLNLPTYETY